MKKNMSVVFRLICIRHGETEANKEMRIQGHLDIPLSVAGEAQARQAGIALQSMPFTRVYTSDLKRASRTCELILNENSLNVENVITEPRIKERNFGSIEGKLFNDILELIQAAGSSWATYNPPGAEALPDVQKRIVGFFKELCQSVYDSSKYRGRIVSDDVGIGIKDLEASESVLLVSHGAALKQLYLHFVKTLSCEGLTVNDDINKISPNTGISEFLVKYSPRKYHLHCIRFGDARHLKEQKDLPQIAM